MNASNLFNADKQQWTMEFILSEAFLSFINLIPEGVIMSNRAGDVVQINTEACRLFGYSR